MCNPNQIAFEVFHPEVLKYTNKYFTSVINTTFILYTIVYTGSSKKMDGIWNRYSLKSTGRIYTFGVLKYSEKFKVLDLP